MKDEYYIIMRDGAYFSKKFSSYEPSNAPGWTQDFRDCRQYRTLASARGQLTSISKMKGYIKTNGATVKRVTLEPRISEI